MKSYVINLARRPDRLSAVTKRFDEVSVDLTPFVAVDARDFPPPGEMDLVPSGIFACWQSHNMLLSEIADGPDETVLIFEDDAVPNFTVDWPLLVERLPSSMEAHRLGFLQLGFVSWQYRFTRPGALERLRSLLYSRSRRTIELDKSRVVIYGSALSGTHSYAVTREFARRIPAINTPCWTGADGLYMRLSSMSGADGIFPGMARLTRSLVEQESRTQRSTTLDSDVS